ncbi:hypothetical protein [Novipirellula artificiosorum]|uniref:Transmembrane protein n=1 Tax=Novipirellula artificiosorum TaxID=2528016 RepID=A0A5C6DR79_9BACT|nr:hypothetical protein [Novipirellula artificiosorum]TWU39350.1 hypothetical protein Poly41_21740 [Novipirellula artificiosorum]
MPSLKNKSRLARWLLLIVGLLCFAIGVWYLLLAPPFEMAGAHGTPLTFLEEEVEKNTLIVVGGFLLTQWLFLCPHGRLKMHLTDSGRPMWLSLVCAALATAMLSIAMIATLLEIPNLWGPFIENMSVAWTVIGILWLIWIGVFFVYWRGVDRMDSMTRMIRLLIKGSILELLVAVPVHVAVWDREKECYCSRGSYTGIVLGTTVLLWAFGPGLVLLFAREFQQRKCLHKISTRETVEQQSSENDKN